MTDQDQPTMRELLADLQFIVEHWDHLAQARIPGTRRPWRQSMLDPDRKAKLAERDRLERAVRDPDAPGFTSAATQIHTFDLMMDIWVQVGELLDRIDRQTVIIPLAPRPGPSARLDSSFARIREWLPILEGVDPRLMALAERGLPRLAREITVTLSLLRGGHLLTGAVCPYCKGSTPKHPSGGQQTLRVEEIIRERKASNGIPAIGRQMGIVCWNPLCDPDSEHCGTRYRGRPAWPEREWEWLAPQLITADPPARSLLDPLPIMIGDVVIEPVNHSGRSGIDGRQQVAPSHDVVEGVRRRPGEILGRRNQRDDPSFDCPELAPGSMMQRLMRDEGLDGYAARELVLRHVRAIERQR